jgi:hypothetical protein
MIRLPTEVYEIAATKLLYDLSSPSGLRWLNGKVAGSQDNNGYWLVRVGSRPGKLLKAHRVIWFMHHKTLPDLVDHENTITSDNAIGNLRDATEGQNRANSNKHIDNTSGAKGVYWDKRTESWLVQCCVNYKTHYAGRFKNRDEAIAEATALREQLHKEFARHA